MKIAALLLAYWGFNVHAENLKENSLEVPKQRYVIAELIIDGKIISSPSISITYGEPASVTTSGALKAGGQIENILDLEFQLLPDERLPNHVFVHTDLFYKNSEYKVEKSFVSLIKIDGDKPSLSRFQISPYKQGEKPLDATLSIKVATTLKR